MLRKFFPNRLWMILVLFALALSATAGVVAYARMLRGDIDIAGGEADLPRRAAPAPYDPSIKFAYDCRLQLNDWQEGLERKIRYKGELHDYELFAYADVVLDQDNRGVNGDNLQWKWIAAIANFEGRGDEPGHIEIPLAGPPADGFSTKGHSLFINVYKQDGGKPLAVSIFGTVKLPVGNYFHFGNGSARGDLESGPLSFYADAELGRSSVPNPRGEPDRLARRLYVECVRK